MSGYRGDFARSDLSSLTSGRSGLPTLGVPPMSVPKPQNLSSHSKEGRSAAETHPTFHRPFEMTSGNKSRTSGSGSGGAGGNGSAGHGLMTQANGYDRESYLEYERKLLAEREKMLAEHRASQEKAQQLRTGSGGSHGTHSSSNHREGGNSNTNKDRGSYSVGEASNRMIGERDREQDLKSSSSQLDNSKHLMYRSPHKSLLPSNCSSGNKSHAQHQQHLYTFGKESGGSNKDHPSGLPKQATHHPHGGILSNDGGSKSSHYTSALTSLQNFSNSKVSSGFSSSVHADITPEGENRCGKTGSLGSSTAPRMNGAYPSNHTRVSHSNNNNTESLVSPTSEKKKEMSHGTSTNTQYPQVQPQRSGGQSRPNNVRSPKKIRQLLVGPGLAKEKLGIR